MHVHFFCACNKIPVWVAKNVGGKDLLQTFSFIWNTSFEFDLKGLIRVVDTMTDIAMCECHASDQSPIFQMDVAHYLSGTFGYNQLKFGGVVFCAIVTGFCGHKINSSVLSVFCAGADCRVHVCDWNESWDGFEDHGQWTVFYTKCCCSWPWWCPWPVYLWSKLSPICMLSLDFYQHKLGHLYVSSSVCVSVCHRVILMCLSISTESSNSVDIKRRFTKRSSLIVVKCTCVTLRQSQLHVVFKWLQSHDPECWDPTNP